MRISQDPLTFIDVMSGPFSDWNLSNFNIPVYQRPYAWRKPACIAYLDDCIESLGDMLRDDNTAFRSGDLSTLMSYLHRGGKSEGFYLGLIILSKEDGIIEVVDGQQRLTTTSLALAALNQLLIANWESQEMTHVQKFLKDTIRESLCTADTPMSVKLTHKIEDEYQNYSNQILTTLSGGNSNTKDTFRKNYKLLYDGFKSRLEEIVSENPNLELEFCTAALAVMLLRTKFIVIGIGVDQRLQFFKTLNSRGVDLTTSELLKNEVYRLLQSQPAKAREAIHNWNEQRKNVGKYTSSPKMFGKHIYYYFNSKPELKSYFRQKSKSSLTATDQLVRESKLFEAVCQYLDEVINKGDDNFDGTTRVYEFITEMLDQIKRQVDIVEIDEVGNFENRFNANTFASLLSFADLSVQKVNPLLVYVIREFNDEYPDSVQELLSALEVFLFRFLIKGSDNRALTRYFHKMMMSIYENHAESDDFDEVKDQVINELRTHDVFSEINTQVILETIGKNQNYKNNKAVKGLLRRYFFPESASIKFPSGNNLGNMSIIDDKKPFTNDHPHYDLLTHNKPDEKKKQILEALKSFLTI